MDKYGYELLSAITVDKDERDLFKRYTNNILSLNGS